MKSHATGVALPTDFDAFLRAPIGEGKNGILLSVLSAFARLDIDPWQEAARLRELPRPTAVERLASLITALPDEPSIQRDSSIHAVRLMALLERSAHVTIVAENVAPDTDSTTISMTAAAIFLFLMFAISMFVSQNVDSTAQPATTSSAHAALPTKALAPSIPASASR
jgi:hypothetical protein